jgi:signal transduction histidine kinase
MKDKNPAEVETSRILRDRAEVAWQGSCGALASLSAEEVRRLVYELEVHQLHSQEKNMVEVLVADNGSGISENIREKIFEPFFTAKPSGKGTGLGLAMVKKMAESCGGNVKIITDTQTTDTIFALSIPMAGKKTRFRRE